MMQMKDYVDEWNKRHCRLVNSEEYLERNEKMCDWLEVEIISAKKSYYAGRPTMEDVVYDQMEEDLKYLRPNSKVLQIVGVPSPPSKIPPPPHIRK